MIDFWGPILSALAQFVPWIIAGLAVYDPATGMIDPAPFNVNLLAGVVAPVVSSFVAGIAVKLGWGSK